MTDVLPAVQAPTLVLYRSADPALAPERAEFIAENVSDASLVDVPGASTFPWLDSSPLLDAVEEFLTGARPVPAGERVLATLLFTDLVELDRRRPAVRRRGLGAPDRATPHDGPP